MIGGDIWYIFNVRVSDRLQFARGIKESYAIKSHKILKQYLQNYENEIMPGYGHVEFLLKYREIDLLY